MAIVMLISNYNVNEPYQYLDDILGVFSDDHPFSDHELQRFNFLTINGTRADVQTRLDQLSPIIVEVYYSVNNQEWQFEIGDGDSYSDAKEVWKYEGNKWFSLINRFKFNFNVSDLTPEEKQLLETYDVNHPSADSAVRKLRKDLTSDPANNVEEKDLRNKNP